MFRTGVGLLVAVLALGVLRPCSGQSSSPAVDTDRDGLSDVLEQRLLDQFSPDFRVGSADCAGVPASFRAELSVPTPAAEDSTIYGQVFPAHSSDPLHPAVEVHFYHLWSRDCGGHGHPLDTEHVAVLLQASGTDLPAATWTAKYWYAAAHENTVCDVSQIARASTLRAEDKGPVVWISPGKHASYLSERLCAGGCGADRCESMRRLKTSRIINLGELQYPMNGIRFLKASQWPLEAKMTLSNFAPATVARVDALPSDDIALYNAGRHPAQGIIAISSSTEGSLAGSEQNTTNAIANAGQNTTGALSVAGDNTGNALHRSLRDTGHALARSARAVGKAVGAEKKGSPEADKAPEQPK